jgi:hypothetical protein
MKTAGQAGLGPTLLSFISTLYTSDIMLGAASEAEVEDTVLQF